jgi:hypothetical protein
VRERDELAQREEGDEAEQEASSRAGPMPTTPRTRAREPERTQLAREPLAQPRLLGRQIAQGAAEGDDRDQREQAEQDDEQQADLLADAERAKRAHQTTPRSAITGGAGAIEKGAPLLAGGERDRRAEDDGAQDRHRHDLALGHDALDVVDPGRDQLDVGERLREREQARLERGRVGGVAARSLREDDQRVAVAERFHQRLERVFVVAAAVLVRWRLT